jgi:ribosomal protein S18 acetylase RimI-like enzyme
MLGSGSKVCVRKGRLADAAALSLVFRESWLFAYRGIIPHLHLEGLVRQRTPEWWRSVVRSGDAPLVLELAGKVAGYATFGAARHRGSFQGEIYELYVDPVYQGLGFGEHLFEGSRHALDMRKLKGLIVWALLDNTPACDFYWRRGGRPVTSTFTKIGGARLEKVAFGWR